MRVRLLLAPVFLVAFVALGCSSKHGSNPGVSGSPSASPTASAPGPAVPDAYRSLYDTLQGYVDGYTKQVDSAWDGTKYDVAYAAELLSADSNGGFGILQPAVRQTMANEMDALHGIGVKAVTIQIGFPILDHDFYISLGQSPEKAMQSVQGWLDYYADVIQSAHSLGMKVIVEANPLLTFFTGSATSLDASGFYKSLTFDAYQRKRSDHNVLVAEQLRPDYLLLQTEPTTDAVNAQNPALARLMSDPQADADMIGYFVAQLDAAGILGLHSTVQLGAGVGTWQSNWQQYADGFTAIPGLDKIDCHIYNLQPGLDEIGAAMKIADIAHAAGKGASIAEVWLHKSTSLAGFTTSGDPLLDVRARDAFSFWAPLDERFLELIAKVANYKRFDYVSAFAFYYWYSLVDYGALTAPCPPTYPAKDATENAACNSRIQTLLYQGAGPALGAHLLTPTGQAYQRLIASYAGR